MKRFILEQSDQEIYTSHSGLALVGASLGRFVDLDGELMRAQPLRHGIPHGDIARSYLGLLCQGKSDFEAIAQFRQGDFFSGGSWDRSCAVHCPDASTPGRGGRGAGYRPL